MTAFFANFVNNISILLPFVLAITILVFIHEYGHFWVARRNGVQVDVFSIGFGPEIFGWTDKHQTRWRISPLPFGGYVKFKGDADVSSTTTDTNAIEAMSEEERSKTLAAKTPLQRIAVAVAGPAANYLYAIIALAILFTVKGMPTYNLRIETILPDRNGEKAGLMVGDILTEINHQPLKTQHDAMRLLGRSAGKDVEIEVARMVEGVKTAVRINAPLYSLKDGTKTNDILGVGFSQQVEGYESTSPISAIIASVSYCIHLSGDMLSSIGRLIMGNGGEMGGIVSIGAMAKQSLDSGFLDFYMFLILLSVNLGLVNLLPVPVLDGGNILFTAIEGMTGRPLPKKIQEGIFIVGLVLVASLMLYTTGSDLFRFRHDILGWFTKFLGA